MVVHAGPSLGMAVPPTSSVTDWLSLGTPARGGTMSLESYELLPEWGASRTRGPGAVWLRRGPPAAEP